MIHAALASAMFRMPPRARPHPSNLTLGEWVVADGGLPDLTMTKLYNALGRYREAMAAARR